MRISRVLSVFTLFFCLAQNALADSVNIYAAASTSEAIDEILAAFAPGSGNEVSAVYAASSTLARQIDAGAPADIFLSANVAWMDDLQGRQRLAAGTRVNLLTNRLVLVAPRMLPLAYEIGGATSLADALGEGRLAIGDPGGVPAGIYAREALTSMGEWDALQSNLVYGDSVRAALTWAARAEVSAAIVYQSDAFSTQSVRSISTFPESMHSPILYPLAIIQGSEDRPAVLAFYEYMRGPRAAQVFEAYGFQLAE